MDVRGQLHALADLPPGERAPGIYWIGGWVGLRDSADAVAKRISHYSAPAGNRTPVVFGDKETTGPTDNTQQASKRSIHLSFSYSQWTMCK
jgi:hypothetical protein